MVLAKPDQRTAIDRETYEVRDTAQARTSNALDILGRIPAITVQPDNSVRLLGTAGVSILIDGRPSPNPNILRDLQGSEIARIEVVSNPSAQYSASGTAGVINIITRRNSLDGLRGSLAAGVSRYGGYELRASPSWTSGDWTLSGNVGWMRTDSKAEFLRERIGLGRDSTAPDSIETTESDTRYEFVNANGQISYRPSEKRTITLQAGLIAADGTTLSDAELLISSNPGVPLAQHIASEYDYGGYNAGLEYRAEGSRPGQLLTTSIQQYRYDPINDVLTDFGSGAFRTRTDSSIRARIFKLDYVRPFQTGRRLLVGGSVNDTREFLEIAQSGDLPLGSHPFPPVSTIDGSYLEGAAYASFQAPFLGGTLLGGLRIEGRDYDFADLALGEGLGDVHFFPSLHFERRLAQSFTGTLSYSRRIAWPAVQQLSPALRFFDATTALIGNPELRPELTDSVEARLRAQWKRQTISLAMFGRRTEDLFSNLNTLTAEGNLLIQPVNVGERLDLGASVAVQGPIVRGLSYTFNANLIDRRIEREEFSILRIQKSTTYSATAQFDYRDGTDGRRGADRVTATFNFSGPYDDGLVHRSSYFRANASWSHALTDRLSSIVTVDDLFGPTRFRQTSISDTALTRTESLSDGPRYKLSLTYSLGRPGQPQPPTPTAPALPVPTGP